MERHNPEQTEKTTEVLQDAVEDGIVNEQLTLIDQIESNRDDVYEWNFSDYEKIAAERAVPTKKSRGLVLLAFILGFALVAVIMMFTIYVVYEQKQPSSMGVTQSKQQFPSLILNDSPAETSDAGDDGQTTAEIATKVTPSVVGIVTYNKDLSYEAAGEGSGVIMSSDGYIVTNAHVLLDSEGYLTPTIKVVLNNSSEYEAEVIGSDIKTDLAVLKIDAENLTYAEFGNSDQVQVGDRVIAIGNPGGVTFMGSVTQGIVSGLNRTVKTSNGTDMTLIQTDAAINPGNSGGALVNRYGQVVGINSAKIKKSNYEGIGFSLPTNSVKPIVDELIKYGYVKDRVKIGFTYREIDSVLSNANGIPEGLYVVSVDNTLDAVTQGLSAGDIVTKINGKSISDTSDLADALDGKKPNDSIKLTIYRESGNSKGTTFEIKVKLYEDQSTIQTAPSGSDYPDDRYYDSDADDDEDIFSIKNTLSA